MGNGVFEKLKEYAEKITAVPSVSGFEDVLAELIVSLIKDKVDDVNRDTLGSVVARKSGSGDKKLKVLFEAHLDQIGLMVTKIEDNGILRFTNIGGINPLALYGKRVRIMGRREVYGVIGMKPPHIATEEELSVVDPLDKLFIDAGFSSGAEVKKIVSVGDAALPDYYSDSLLGEHFCSSGLDNKAGVLALLAAVDLVSARKNYHDIYFLFSTQEEVGLRGATVGGFAISPDIAVVCDVTFGDPGGAGIDVSTGKGPAIGKGPGYNPSLVRRLCEIAKQEDIPVQDEVESHPGGTDAYSLQITRQGVYTAGISIPLRYMHSQTEIINMKDVYRASKLLVHVAMEEKLIPLSKEGEV